jgi:hypothetical protein
MGMAEKEKYRSQDISLEDKGGIGKGKKEAKFLMAVFLLHSVLVWFKCTSFLGFYEIIALKFPFIS